MALKIKINYGDGLKINDDTKALEVNRGNGLVIGNAGDIQVKPNSNKGINVTADGVEVKVDGETITNDSSGNLKVVAMPPDIESGQGINISNAGETKRTISAKIDKGLEYDSNGNIVVKAGNSVNVTSDGVTVNTGRGINKQSNQIGLNANFTPKPTPLGDESSNIELYSDGKIKVVGGGGGTYTQGIGIDINNNNVISAKIDDNTIKVNDNGDMTVANIKEGDGVVIESAESEGNTTKTIKAKIGDGLNFGDSLKEIKVNANFTPKTTPLGDSPSNIELYSDGKIKVVGGGGGGGILYAQIDNATLKSKFNHTNNFIFFNNDYKDYSARLLNTTIINKSDFTILQNIDENNYIFLLAFENGVLNFGREIPSDPTYDTTLDIAVKFRNSVKYGRNYYYDEKNFCNMVWARRGQIFESVAPRYYLDFKNLFRLEVSYWIQYIMGNNTTQISLSDNTNISDTNGVVLNIYAIPKN